MRLPASLISVLIALAVGHAAGRVAAHAGAGGQGLGDSFFDALDHPAIAYGARPFNDPVAALSRRLQSGSLHLAFDPKSGYLAAVLDALAVPIASQMAVFSKTSLQARLITPQNPRAIFFNDAVAVTWTRGGFIEMAAQDPQQGVAFYMLEQREVEKPLITRPAVCVSCHHSYDTLGVPGLLLRSQATTADGRPAPQRGNFVTDHRSPLDERWGGWFVTGQLGEVRHMGRPAVTLRDAFDTDGYLAPYSDVAALMVFAHQARMMNLITRVGWEVRVAESDHRPDLEALLRTSAAELVDYLLFVDEAPLSGALRGTSGFSERFAALGPRDERGRSLRQLDLGTRLLRYPCSYMIYSPAFDGLPASAGTAIYQRMWAILSGEDQAPKYARMTAPDRRAVVEILRGTKADLPPWFVAAAVR